MSCPAADKAELNYQACRLVDRHFQSLESPPGYDVISSAIHALEDAADEIRRRFLHPYEDAAIAKNRDVFHCSLWGRSI